MSDKQKGTDLLKLATTLVDIGLRFSIHTRTTEHKTWNKPIGLITAGTTTTETELWIRESNTIFLFDEQGNFKLVKRGYKQEDG